MRSLYESILDDDEKTKGDISGRAIEMLLDFLGLNVQSGSRVGLKTEIRDDKLYISSSRNSYNQIDITINGDKVIRKYSYARGRALSFSTVEIPVKLLDNVYFERVILKLTVINAKTPTFLSHCTDCDIIYNSTITKGLDKILSNTTDNSIAFTGDESRGDVPNDFSCVSGLNLKNCRVILHNPADLSTVKGLTTGILIIQRGSVFHASDKTHFDVYTDKEMSDWEIDQLNAFINRNNITSLGVVQSHVFYVGWLMKKGNDFNIKILEYDKKRVPKLNG